MTRSVLNMVGPHFGQQYTAEIVPIERPRSRKLDHPGAEALTGASGGVEPGGHVCLDGQSGRAVGQRDGHPLERQRDAAQQGCRRALALPALVRAPRLLARQLGVDPHPRIDCSGRAVMCGWAAVAFFDPAQACPGQLGRGQLPVAQQGRCPQHAKVSRIDRRGLAGAVGHCATRPRARSVGLLVAGSSR
jgi:hypothetical protein